MPELFTLNIASANTVNRTGSSPNSYTYQINWTSVIPEKFRANMFKINFSFFSVISATSGSQVLGLYAQGLNLKNFDSTGTNSQLLGVVYPSVLKSTSVSNWQASVSDNCTITGSYPSSPQLNINFLAINDFTTPSLAMLNYVLTITFEPILD